MSDKLRTWLTNIRTKSAEQGAFGVLISGSLGSIVVFPEDILGKSDEDLYEYIKGRLIGCAAQ